jgi:methionyl-tRNA synthetase
MDQFIQTNAWIIVLLALWTVPWKGVALWKAARNDDKAWFIVLLIVNTLAILEIFYIFIFSKRKTK